jgi:murein DD-endopeptidase MepM/ murein hydrolase activator NlpD
MALFSRIKISPYGYGRALYLNDPQGLTTVYAHLQRFAPVD